MDLIFYLFLVIAIINFVANAVKRARSQEESSRHPGRFRSTMRSRPAGDQPGLERARPGEERTGLPLRPAHLPEPERDSGLRPATSPRPGTLKGAVPVNMVRIFTEKEQLLAAFIFHEVLGPPRSLRRR